MVKTYQNLELFGPDLVQKLSILESRKTTWLTITFSERLQTRTTPQRTGLCRKAGSSSSENKRTSEILFIDKWYKSGRNKPELKEYGIEARGLNLSPSMRPSWTPPLMRSV